jgi:hypothetical protein
MATRKKTAGLRGTQVEVNRDAIASKHGESHSPPGAGPGRAGKAQAAERQRAILRRVRRYRRRQTNRRCRAFTGEVSPGVTHTAARRCPWPSGLIERLNGVGPLRPIAQKLSTPRGGIEKVEATGNSTARLPCRGIRARKLQFFSQGDEHMKPKRTRRARIDPRLILWEIASDRTAAPMARVSAARALLRIDPAAGEEDDRVDGLTRRALAKMGGRHDR